MATLMTLGCPTRGNCPSPTATPEELSRRSVIQRNDLLLHESVIKNDSEGVRRILREPCDVNSRNNYGRAPIHWASARGNLEIMEMLVNANCDIEAKDKAHYTLLTCAARNNRADVVDLLLDALENVDLNSVDTDGQTALFHAASHGHACVVKRLIEMGASTDRKNKESRTALHEACQNGHAEVVQFLLSHEADMESRDKEENTALHIASQHQQTRLVQILLDHGSDPDSENQKGCTPLHIAASLGSKGILELLLQHGAHLSKQNTAGNTPLHMACQANELEAIRILINKGAELNCLNKRLQTPIHIAAEMGHTEICKLLLSAGADIEQREQGGRTPLYIAARGSFTAIVDMIIKTARLDSPQHENPPDATKKENSGIRPKLSRKWRSTSKDEGRQKESERLKEVLYKLAYKHLGPGEWKNLAAHWAFTEDQIKAIEHQYNGPQSYKEHGFRMMLIWSHGLTPDVNPVKELYESLSAIGKRPLADTLRRKIDQENAALRKGQKEKCNSCTLS